MKIIILPLFVVLGFLMLIVSGCGPTISSADVNSSAFYPTFCVIQETGVSMIEVSAGFEAGGAYGSFIELVPEESITCNGTVLTKSEAFLDLRYKGEFASPASQYVFRYHNSSGEEIDTTLGALPAVPTMASIADFSEGQDVTVNWDASAPGTETMIFLTTTGGISIFYPVDNGHYVITHSELLSRLDYLGPGIYDLEFEVIRRITFPANPYFKKGGYVFTESIDSKTVKFTKTSPATTSSDVGVKNINQKAALLRARVEQAKE